MSNPTLGTIDCPTCAAAGAEVRQTKRRGARLYWQCNECGLNQPTGAKVQQMLWDKTAWVDGAEPTRPSNVTSEPLAAATDATEFDPNEADAESEAQPAPKASGRPSRGRGVGLLMLGAVGLGVLLSAN